MANALAEKEKSIKYGKMLEYFTIFWNLIEGFVAVGAGLFAGSVALQVFQLTQKLLVGAGLFAGSVALVGFGFDSFIEVSSGTILLWRLYVGEKYERKALQLVGVSLFILAAYVGFEATKKIIYAEAPEASYTGIAVAILSLIVMRWLASEKRKVSKAIHSHALEVDAKQTDICVYLSAILLGGLGLNALFGWWWADPVAGLFMTPIILKEGIGAAKGTGCNTCSH